MGVLMLMEGRCDDMRDVKAPSPYLFNPPAFLDESQRACVAHLAAYLGPVEAPKMGPNMVHNHHHRGKFLNGQHLPCPMRLP